MTDLIPQKQQIIPPHGYRLMNSGEKAKADDLMLVHGAWLEVGREVRVTKWSVPYATRG